MFPSVNKATKNHFEQSMCISRNLSRRLSESVSPFMPELYDVQKPSMEIFMAASQEAESSDDDYINGHYSHRAHHIVTHNYHDHSNAVDDGAPEPVARGGVTTAFPIKLHEMLDQIEQDGFGHVVSWQPHGRCFVVHKPKEFVDHVMPTYFKQSKFPSFQRQLNLYGFQRLTKGTDKGGYYHELFLRGRIFLAHRILRMRVKGTGVRARGNPDCEPNFYQMKPILQDSAAKICTAQTPSTPMEKDELLPFDVMSSVDGPMASVSPDNFGPLDAFSDPFDDDDILADFEGMPFHMLDTESNTNVDSLLQSEEIYSGNDFDKFLEKLSITRDLYNDIIDSIDDDQQFGDCLQRIIE